MNNSLSFRFINLISLIRRYFVNTNKIIDASEIRLTKAWQPIKMYAHDLLKIHLYLKEVF